MIYVCVPAHNEARTVGLVLWKVRQVFTAFPREYQLLVADDASSDGTAAVLASYAKVLPLSIVTHRERRGYARSLEELLRLALQRTDRAKRDCAITLHADFVHSPECMEEMVKRIESGADLVVAEQREERGRAPRALWFARQWTPRLLPVPGVKDTVSGFCALRLSVLRQALGGGGGRDAAPLLATDGWCASAELLARLAPHARRVDAIPAAARYDLVQRPSRVQPWRQLLAAWQARAVIRAARTVGVALAVCAAALRAQSDSARSDSSPHDSLLQIGAVGPAVPFPVGERLVYQATFPDPLDDAAFLYWIRTVPLEVGKRYEYQRYFRPERNPVIVEVLGRERVGVAGRKWKATVIRPRIPNGGGIFAERADARMWLSDDDRHMMLALQSNFSFGQVTMKLKEYSDPPLPRGTHDRVP